MKTRILNGLLFSCIVAISYGAGATTKSMPQQQTVGAGTSQKNAIANVIRTRSLPQYHVIGYASSQKANIVAASLENNSIRIINPTNGQTTKVLNGHPQPAYAVAFSPDGKRLASGDETARIWLWDLASGKKIGQLPFGHQRGIQHLSFSPNGMLLASTGKDDVVRIYNVKSGKIAATLLGAGANFSSATFSPDGNLLIIATLGSGVHFYNGKTFKKISQADPHGGRGVTDVAVSGNRMVSGGRDGSTALWDLSSKKVVKKMKGHDDWVVRVALGPKGNYCASSSNDRKVVVWNLSTGTPFATINDQCTVGSPLAFTNDGTFLTTANDADAMQIYKIAR